jgi:hypothetical protein
MLGYADVPSSRDITKKSGMVDEYGNIKLGASLSKRFQRSTLTN